MLLAAPTRIASRIAKHCLSISDATVARDKIGFNLSSDSLNTVSIGNVISTFEEHTFDGNRVVDLDEPLRLTWYLDAKLYG